jgi:hypothetical protein
MPGLLGRFKNVNTRFNGLLGGLTPMNTAGGLLPGAEAEDAQRQAQLAMAASFLQSSGPSPMPVSFGQALGGGLMAGQNAQNNAIDSALTRQLLMAQTMNQLNPGREDRTPNDILMLDALGLPHTPEGMAQLTKVRGSQGTTINIGDKLNEPIPITQLSDVRLPDGSTPPIGTTFKEAREMGAQVQSSAEQQRATQTQSAMGILDELQGLALGPNGAFTNIEPGLINRAGAALTHMVDMVTQERPEVSRYEDLSRSALAPFIKSLGESGALAEGDVQRALGLLPRVWPLPDTADVAAQKFEALKKILDTGIRKYNEKQGTAGEIPPLPAGFTLDEEP